jgi:hypothetical protein
MDMKKLVNMVSFGKNGKTTATATTISVLAVIFRFMATTMSVLAVAIRGMIYLVKTFVIVRVFSVANCYVIVAIPATRIERSHGL